MIIYYKDRVKQVDMQHFIKAFNMDVLCSCAYGINTDSVNNPGHPFVVNIKKILNMNINIGRVLSMLAPKVARLFNIEFFDSKAINFFTQQSEMILMETKIDGNYGKLTLLRLILVIFQIIRLGEQANLQQLIMRANKGTGTNDCMTTDEMISQVLMFLIVGSDTTATALSHIIYSLAQNKVCQDKLYEEIKDADQLSYDKIIELKYLKALIDETLRLYPPLIHMPRVCVKDTQLNGKNSFIILVNGIGLQIVHGLV